MALLAILDDREPLVRKLKAELERDAALAKASDDVEVRFAQASFAFSTAELNLRPSIGKVRFGERTGKSQTRPPA